MVGLGGWPGANRNRQWAMDLVTWPPDSSLGVCQGPQQRQKWRCAGTFREPCQGRGREDSVGGTG